MARQARGGTRIAPRPAAGRRPARGPGDGPGRSRLRSQGGFGLLEAVVSLALVSTVVLTLAGGLLTSVKSSTSARGTQQVDAALSAYAESFKGVAFDALCPLPVDLEGAGTAPAWFTAPGTDVESFRIVVTEGWNEDTSDWQDCASYDESYSGPEPGTVRLTVEVEVRTDDSPDPRSSTGQVVVRRDA